jgi:hypothetical protein
MARQRLPVTAERLYRYASGYQGRHQAWPTLRTCAQRFGCSLDAVEAAVEQYQGDGYLGVAVALGVRGAGHFDLPRAQHLVEAYGENDDDRGEG